MDEDAALEFEALASILGDDMWSDPNEPTSFMLCVAPEHDAASEITGAAALFVVLPAGYPSSAPASIVPRRLSECVHRFPHMAMASSSPPTVSWEDADLSQLQPVLSAALADHGGEPVIYEAVEAVRAYLATHTLRARPPLAARAKLGKNNSVYLSISPVNTSPLNAKPPCSRLHSTSLVTCIAIIVIWVRGGPTLWLRVTPYHTCM